MKKFLSVILILVMAFPAVSVTAQGDYAPVAAKLVPYDNGISMQITLSDDFKSWYAENENGEDSCSIGFLMGLKSYDEDEYEDVGGSY